MIWDLTDPKNKEIRQNLKKRLHTRKLSLIDKEVESHGPHYPEMPREVWICGVKEDETSEEGWVVLYPKAIYWIDSPDDWWNPDEDMRVRSL